MLALPVSRTRAARARVVVIVQPFLCRPRFVVWGRAGKREFRTRALVVSQEEYAAGRGHHAIAVEACPLHPCSERQRRMLDLRWLRQRNARESEKIREPRNNERKHQDQTCACAFLARAGCAQHFALCSIFALGALVNARGARQPRGGTSQRAGRCAPTTNAAPGIPAGCAPGSASAGAEEAPCLARLRPAGPLWRRRRTTQTQNAGGLARSCCGARRACAWRVSPSSPAPRDALATPAPACGPRRGLFPILAPSR